MGDHKWMAFLDVDEFLVLSNLQPADMPDLPALLREYEPHGGLVRTPGM